MRDEDRVRRIASVLDAAELDAVVCTLPSDVLLLSGYWPVIGTTIAVASRAGRIGVLAPEDERDLAVRGWADPLVTFAPGSLETLRRAADTVRGPLARLARALGLRGGRIGYADGEMSEPASYAAVHLYGETIESVIATALPRASLVSADDVLATLRGTLTAREIQQVTRACEIAGRAFEAGANCLHAGATELEVAAAFRAPLSTHAGGDRGDDGVVRADGFTYCMSGANAAKAGGAYARSRAKRLERGELVLIHCNSYVDGYWTDITRTYVLGPPPERVRRLYEAVFDARAAALDVLRPGVRGSEVDHAVRSVLDRYGYGAAFTHGTGHGVGFAAIDQAARPRLHPASDDVLEPGMVFNIEPAIYLKRTDEAGGAEHAEGLRHCDVVALESDGAHVLTPFHATLDELTLT
jgi:Xaa-Pro aminopeptidase